MKIDLRKDRGILGSSKFFVAKSGAPEKSDDELIIETLRRRHSGGSDEPQVEQVQNEPTEPQKTALKSNRNPLRELILLLLMLSSIAYYLNDKSLLIPSIDVVKGYWMDVVGITPDEAVDLDYPDYSTYDTLDVEGIMTDEMFEQLMPVTEDIAALADSLGSLAPESLFVDTLSLPGTMDTIPDYLAVAENPIMLSDDDLTIINNRSLLLMLTEMIGVIPEDIGDAHLFLKRDALRMTAPQGDVWVTQMKSILDKFVLGSFTEDYSAGNIKISSKFEIIMNAEQDFEAQVMDEMRLLDVLAHPFNDYLQQIIIDLARGVDDNPAKFTFAGSPQEMQYILFSWAETRSNYLLRSVDIIFENNQLNLTFEVIFFNYTP